MGRYYDVEVTHTEMLSVSAKRVNIRRCDGEPFRFRAGQFLMMWFEHAGRRMSRSYSVAGPLAAGETVNTMELCIAIVDGGVGSAMVAKWERGARLTISGPHGRFVLRDGEERDVVLVGTGTGIAPYRSMIPGLTTLLNAGHRVDLVFGARDEEQFLYADEWKQLASEHEGFNYWACADDAKDPQAWAASGGIVGRVQTALDAIADRTGGAVFYVCGNPAMVEDVKARLADAGIERVSIRTEAYVSPAVS